MKRKISILTVLFFGLTVLGVSAQNATILFGEKKHDFGQIEERGGNAVHSFEFKNTGNAPLIIQRVTASCGCTTPDWTKTPIEPGKTGYIKVSYNPIGRPGSFTKSITVMSNASNEREMLYISGSVNRDQAATTQQTQSGVNYAARIGNLHLTSKDIDYGILNKNSKSISRTLTIQNNSSANMNIEFAAVPSFLKITASPRALKANEVGTVSITFDPAKVSEWGPVESLIQVVVNGARGTTDQTAIRVTANVSDDFSKMSQSDKQQAPIFEVKSTNLAMGSIKKGNRVRGQVLVKNSGTNQLEIRRIVNSNSDITISPARVHIRGGKSEHLKIEINSKFIPVGDYKKTFTVYTNDPLNPVVIFNVSYKVN